MFRSSMELYLDIMTVRSNFSECLLTTPITAGFRREPIHDMLLISRHASCAARRSLNVKLYELLHSNFDQKQLVVSQAQDSYYT